LLTAELHNQGVMNENTLKNQGGGQVLKRVQSVKKKKKIFTHLFYIVEDFLFLTQMSLRRK